MAAGAVIFFGRAVSGFGRVQANQAQGRALVRNARALDFQADRLEKTKTRSLNLFDREIENFESAQVSSYAKAGVDISSGSALAVVAQTRVDAFGEREAIKDDFENRIMNMRFQANQARSEARNLTSTGNQVMTFVSSIFGG